MSAGKEAAHPHLVAAESEPQAYEKVLANSQGLIVTVVSLRYCCPHGPLPPLENMDDVYASCSVASNSLQPFGCSLPGFLVHGISQARILERVAIFYSRGLPNPGIKPASLVCPALAGRFFTTSAPWKAHPCSLFYFYLLFYFFVF